MAKTETKTEQAAATYTKEQLAATYTKEQLAASKRYANRRDLIRALLEDGKAYTLKEADELIEKYMKGKVN